MKLNSLTEESLKKSPLDEGSRMYTYVISSNVDVSTYGPFCIIYKWLNLNFFHQNRRLTMNMRNKRGKREPEQIFERLSEINCLNNQRVFVKKKHLELTLISSYDFSKKKKNK